MWGNMLQIAVIYLLQLAYTYKTEDHRNCKFGVNIPRDVVLEASASARGGREAVFLAGSASPRPHTVLPQSRPYCLGSAS